MDKRGANQIVIFVILTFVSFIILGFVFSGGLFKINNVSCEDLIDGASLNMDLGKSAKIDLCGEKYSLKVEDMGDNWTVLSIKGDERKMNLDVNEVQELDVNFDGTSDLRVKLFKIVDGQAVIALKKIDKDACAEDWSCGEWGSCVSGKRERVCVDKNDCGSDFYKPYDTIDCVGS